MSNEEIVKLLKKGTKILLPKQEHFSPAHAAESHTQFQWMVDFTEEHVSNRKFFEYAEKARNRKHPFRGYKDILYHNGRENKTIKGMERSIGESTL